MSMSGQAIYENFKNGVGPAGLTDAAAIVNELAGEYEAEGDSIKQLMEQMESVWQGGATRGAGPLAVEHLAAAPDIAKAQELIDGQAGAFDEAKRTVQPVPPAPEEPGLWDNIWSLGGAQDTYEAKLAATNAASQANVDEMPMMQTEVHHAVPVYEEMPGWWEDISTARDFDELPANARGYVERVEELSGARVSAVGVGPGRDQTIVRHSMIGG